MGRKTISIPLKQYITKAVISMPSQINKGYIKGLYRQPVWKFLLERNSTIPTYKVINFNIQEIMHLPLLKLFQRA
jgi:hypothetical protein